MGKRKDLSDFDKGQIVMARRLGQSISKTAALAGCSRSAVVSTYQKWSKEGKAVNRRQGHGRPRLIDARGERRLARVVQSNKRATVGQIAEKVNAGSDRKVSEHTVHRSLLRMGLRRRRPVRVPMLTCKDDQEEEKEQSTLPMPPDRVEYQKDKEQEQSTPLSPPDQVDYKEKENKEQSTSSSPLRNVSLSPNADLTPDPPGATTGPCGPPSPSDLCRSDDVF